MLTIRVATAAFLNRNHDADLLCINLIAVGTTLLSIQGHLIIVLHLLLLSLSFLTTLLALLLLAALLGLL